MLKAVIYARVSSKEQEKEGYSIPAQVELFKQYAKTKNLTIVKEYLESESAKKSGRKLFNEMLSFVKQNRIDAIVFEKVDRATRNYHDLVAVYDLIESSNVDVHFVKNGLILNQNSKSQEKFQLDIQVVLARNYINNLSEETKKGMKQKLLEGGWTAKAPTGYKNVRVNAKATVVPDENAPIVQRMFDLAERNYSVGQIMKEVEPDIQITRSTVHKILKDTFYIGYMKSNGELYKGNYETIISHMQFDLVQQKLSKRDTNKITSTKREFRFSGLVTCECGCKMYAEVKKKKYVTYGCSARQHKRECNSSVKYLSEKKVFEQLNELIKKVSLTPETKAEIDKIINKMFAQIEKESKQHSQVSLNKANQIKDKLSRLYDNFDEGLLSKEEFVEHKERLNQQFIKAQAELAAHIIVPVNTREEFHALYEPMVNLHKYWDKIEDYSDFQQILKSIFTNLAMKDGKLSVTWTELGAFLYKHTKHLNWLRKADEVRTILKDSSTNFINGF